MAAQVDRGFPDWRQIYRDQPVESMPWYTPGLDCDVATELARRSLAGATVLDVGTGPGTQAIELARRGFRVTATDVSEDAIRLAQAKAAALGLAIDWRQDDILATQLVGPFEVALDRGCFHVFAPGDRATYVKAMTRLLAPGGLLLLKCFSRMQPGEQGPHRFTPNQIRELFAGKLSVCDIRESAYEGTLEPQPWALFCVLQK